MVEKSSAVYPVALTHRCWQLCFMKLKSIRAIFSSTQVCHEKMNPLKSNRFSEKLGSKSKPSMHQSFFSMPSQVFLTQKKSAALLGGCLCRSFLTLSETMWN